MEEKAYCRTKIRIPEDKRQNEREEYRLKPFAMRHRKLRKTVCFNEQTNKRKWRKPSE